MITLTSEAERDLKKYLLENEDEIYFAVSAFGDLNEVFISVFGREPEPPKF